MSLFFLNRGINFEIEIDMVQNIVAQATIHEDLLFVSSWQVSLNTIVMNQKVRVLNEPLI